MSNEIQIDISGITERARQTAQASIESGIKNKAYYLAEAPMNKRCWI